MRKRYYVLIVIFILYILFLSYCFVPVAFHHEKNKPEAIILTDRNDVVITNKANEFGYCLPGDYDLQSQFIQDLLTIEDDNYFRHLGVDIFSKIRAFRDNIMYGSFTGGSTITEQYIKNRYFQKSSRSYMQKLREAQVSFIFSLKIPKNQMLTYYLNQVYVGNNIYGISTATKVYFNKSSLNELNEEEIVLLLALIHNPGVTNINDKEFHAYFEKVKNRLGYDFKNSIFELGGAPSIDEFPLVTRRFMQETGKNTGKVTIDSDVQRFSEGILNKTLEKYSNKNITNGAILGIDPKTMEVLIYIGSRDFYSENIDGQYDVITSRRQPGSTFKPFLYLQALKLGAGVNTMLIDIENQYNSFVEGRSYVSENYTLKEYGLIELKRALGNSLNNASVRLAREIGLEKVFDFYKSYGFDLLYDNPQHYGYSFVLGNPSITLENLVISYVNLLPHFTLDDSRKMTLSYEEDEDQIIKRYNQNITQIDPEKFLLYDILSNPDNRDISFGVDSILNTSIMQAVKTGTSSNFRDNLVVSYHPDLVLGVWVGNNDNSPMKGVTGITGAGSIWHSIIEELIDSGYIENKEYPVPEGVTKKPYKMDIEGNRVKNEYDKTDIEYRSRVLDFVFYYSDIFEDLSKEEINRLDELSIGLIK